jgi:hypothetical protein
MTSVQAMLSHLGTSPKYGAKLELEYRTIISKHLINIEGYVMTQSKSIIKRSGDTSIIRQEMYENGELVKEFCYKKDLISSIRINNGTLALSSETPMDCLKLNGDTIHRLKCRFSKIHMINGFKWSIDITVSYTVNVVDSTTRAEVEKMQKVFLQKEVTLKSFVDLDVSYEAEIELLDEYPKTCDITDVVISEAISYINGICKTITTDKSVIYKLKRMLQSNGNTLKSILNNVKTITISEYMKIYPPNNFYIMAKIDGVRALFYNHDGITTMLIDGQNSPTISTINAKTTLVDGEYFNNIFYPFDWLYVDGINLTGAIYSDRMKHAKVANEIIKSSGIHTIVKPILSMNNPDLEKIVETIIDPKQNFEVDGLIITKNGQTYNNTESYKIKTQDMNTIDFLLKKKSTIVETGVHTYVLFCGIGEEIHKHIGIEKLSNYTKYFPNLINKDYYPIQFQTCLMPDNYYFDSTLELDGTVVELRLTQDWQWEFVKIRDDRTAELNNGRYFGNDYKIAESILMNTLCPFKYSDLWNPTMYFKNVKKDIYKLLISTNNKMKDMQINEHLVGTKKVIDLGAGRGGDIWRYNKIHVKELMCVDSDPHALAELVRRRYSYTVERSDATSISVIHADLNDHYEINLKKIYKYYKTDIVWYQAVVCNMAIHYMMKNDASLINFCTLVYSILEVGGKFLVSCFDGKKIFDMIMKNNVAYNEYISLNENGVKKYSIQRKFKENVFLSTSQYISVLMPFSLDNYYDEPLVNVEALVKELNNFNIKLLSQTYTEDKIPEPDNTYASLYTFLVFVKE